jgi:hypothetical protein
LYLAVHEPTGKRALDRWQGRGKHEQRHYELP